MLKAGTTLSCTIYILVEGLQPQKIARATAASAVQNLLSIVELNALDLA